MITKNFTSNISIISLVIAKLFLPSEDDCPAGYVFYLKGICYKFVNVEKSYNDAKDHCKSDLAENLFWASLLAEPRTAEAGDAAWHLLSSMRIFSFDFSSFTCAT